MQEELKPILDVIEDAPTVPASGEWISCKDAMPGRGQRVIVTVYGSDLVFPENGETIEEAAARTFRECVEVTVAFYDEDGWYGPDGFPMMIRPSHWMPLPHPAERED